MKRNVLQLVLLLIPITIITGATFFTLHSFDYAYACFYVSFFLHLIFIVLAAVEIIRYEHISFLSKILLLFFMVLFPFIGGMMYIFVFKNYIKQQNGT